MQYNHAMMSKKLLYIFSGMALAAAAKWFLFQEPSATFSNSPSQKTDINWVQPRDEKITILESKSKCLLHKGKCRNKVDEKNWIEVHITPLPIHPNKTLKITVTASSDNIVPQEVDFEGLNLNMGFIRPRLTKIAGNTYETEVVLPICDEKVMEWRALVLFSELSKSTDTFGSKFHFTSTSN